MFEVEEVEKIHSLSTYNVALSKLQSSIQWQKIWNQLVEAG